MVTRTRRRAKRRLPLSRERVLQTRASARRSGRARVTARMRKLGQELGVEAMALY